NAPTLPATGPIRIHDLTGRDPELPHPPIEIEIGPGRGAFIIERAAEVPDGIIVGLEIKYKWAKIVDDRLNSQGHGNHARVFAADARFTLPRLEPNECISQFFIHFPDPWWKKRQQKRLVINPLVMRDIVRLLVPGGTVFIQTDVLERGEQYETLLSSANGLEPFGDTPLSPILSNPPWQAKSNRERRVIDAGLTPTRLRFRKPMATPPPEHPAGCSRQLPQTAT
ncbi:MAG: hypothetical protein FWD57_08705, partial [Polyangiaceae bacterium]|nr:hypothetical protein [Polyangiaceae bacterium]